MIEKIWGKQIKNHQSTHGKGGIAFKKSLVDELGIDNLFNKSVLVGVDHYFGEQVLKNKYAIYFAKNARVKSYLNKTLKGFMKDALRWKKGYFDLISLGRTFLIALFNFVIMLSLISFIFNPVSFFSFPFILYSVGSFIKCTRVAKSSSNISFLFYFPIYLFISVVDRILTCHVLVKKALGFNNQEVHFKGERK